MSTADPGRAGRAVSLELGNWVQLCDLSCCFAVSSPEPQAALGCKGEMGCDYRGEGACGTTVGNGAAPDPDSAVAGTSRLQVVSQRIEMMPPGYSGHDPQDASF